MDFRARRDCPARRRGRQSNPSAAGGRAGQKTPRPPKLVRAAALVTALLGIGAAGFGVAVAVAFVLGRRNPALSGPATAVAFLALGGMLLAAAWSFTRGKTWGTGVVVLLCLLLLPISYAAVVNAQQPAIGVPLGFAALVDLACLLAPSTTRWVGENRTF